MNLQICPPDPPNLSSIVRNNDVLQPSKEQEVPALERSRAYWYPTALLARTYPRQGLPSEFTNPQHALHRVPRFPGPLKAPFGRPFGRTQILALCALTSSTWRFAGDASCDGVRGEITRLALVQIGTQKAIPFSFSGDVFRQWVGTSEEKLIGANYLGILAAGWCYVLSAWLVEVQGDGAGMCYTNSQADIGSNTKVENFPERTHSIDLGEEASADAKLVRWWSAILAKDEGWNAVVQEGRLDGDAFVTPWMVTRTCETSFIVETQLDKDVVSSERVPLSWSEAFDALAGFARTHALGSQLSIALAVAMSVPMHRYYGTEVRCPPPSTCGAGISPTSSDDMLRVPNHLKDDLPYYITLSCSPEVMISTLCGAFWQPNIPCNMVTQWLHPFFEEILPSTSEAKSQELAALICAIRRPTISALWIGAAISGIVPTLLERVKRGRSPVDAVAFPWTGARQSFMDELGEGPYTCPQDVGYISRPDVWRLLLLSPIEEDELAYGCGPPTPWEPCGVSGTRDCALRVSAHIKCSRHGYSYDHWTWDLDNGTTVRDYGFSSSGISRTLVSGKPSDISKIDIDSHSFVKKDLGPDREASEKASMDIFRWFVLGGEGVPPEKIYRDEWLRGLWDDEEDSDDEVDGSHRVSESKCAERFES